MNNKIIVIPADRKAYILTLKNETPGLSTLQGLVGGYVETVPALFEGTLLICNEEGKLLNLPVNEHATNVLKDAFQDVIAGTAVWVQNKGVNFCGFTEERANKILKVLNGED